MAGRSAGKVRGGQVIKDLVWNAKKIQFYSLDDRGWVHVCVHEHSDIWIPPA